ncbi:hypothetical protein [Acidithiobacillus sp. HP-11]|uniref:hypothetical protein n=1 Tax=Acidithiobacillus sp. HP-11 TaxID=2697656 RepID=UPI001D0CFF12|nr:hypothetical protein [Acidithiobacillus sp. HP-11]
MPAGRIAECEACYWRGLLKKRIAMNQAAFSAQTMARHFEHYAAWLAATVGENKAAITLNKYLSFFLEMEKVWKDLPDYARLVAHFGAEGLRRVRLPMRWMQETGLVSKDDAVLRDDSEKRQIEQLLKTLEGNTKGSRILKEYHDALMLKANSGKLRLRSVRLALTPARALLLEAQKMGLNFPSQKAVERYLGRVPGQRAALTGFVRFLHEMHSANIAIPQPMDGAVQKARQIKLEKELMAMMRDGDESDEFIRRWVSVGLAYFHGLPKNIGRNVALNLLENEDEGIVIKFSGKSYWLPSVARKNHKINVSYDAVCCPKL